MTIFKIFVKKNPLSTNCLTVMFFVPCRVYGSKQYSWPGKQFKAKKCASWIIIFCKVFPKDVDFMKLQIDLQIEFLINRHTLQNQTQDDTLRGYGYFDAKKIWINRMLYHPWHSLLLWVYNHYYQHTFLIEQMPRISHVKN